MSGFPVHAERIVDGNAATLTALTLYEAGSVTARTLGAKEIFHITDVLIVTEDAGDAELVAGTAVAGKYIVSTKTASGVPIAIRFSTPFVCAPGVVPAFSGPGANRSTCTIQGFVRER